ncbi:acyl carrier protein [Flavobacterium sp. H122]|uniref:acyl carrier protein n=1 Tax=Flavobacterium sp. H122 TaxID=2529860 RepID=UPI00145B8DCE|nr:acyl carrier protein [Flavobacterium sp. H122]
MISENNISPEKTLTISNAATVAEIQNWLISKISSQLNLSPSDIDITTELATYGLDSMDAVMISGELEDALEIELASTVLWDYPTIESLSAFLYNTINSNE